MTDRVVPVSQPTPGENVRRCRMFRGLSLDQLAALTGYGKSYLSMIENGTRRLTRQDTTATLACALRVSITDITGQPYDPVDEVSNEAHASIPALRVALMDADLACPPDHRPALSLESLAARVRQARERQVACDYAALGQALPDLLPELHAAVLRARGQAEHAEALRLYVNAAFSARAALKALGALDLAMLAAQRAGEGARRLDDPVWQAAAVWHGAQVRVAAGAYASATAYSSSAAARFPGSLLNQPVGIQALGALHLVSALGFARLGDRRSMETHLVEATDLAARVEDPFGSDARDVFGVVFGESNVRIHHATCAVDSGQADTAISFGQAMPPGLVTGAVPERAATFHTDIARARCEVGDDSAALRHLLSGEERAPQRVHNNSAARETVAQLLTNGRVPGSGRDLRALAYRMGLPHGGPI